MGLHDPQSCLLGLEGLPKSGNINKVLGSIGWIVELNLCRYRIHNTNLLAIPIEFILKKLDKCLIFTNKWYQSHCVPTHH